MNGEDQRYRRLPDVRYRWVADEAVVLKQESGELVVLDEVGARILDLLDGERTLAQLLETLGAEFDAAPEALASDIPGFLRELKEAGVIEPVPG